MEHIGFAGQKDREALRYLWLESFEDTPEAVDFFLSNWLLPGNCVAAWDRGKLVAALYLLPGVWQEEGRRYPAQYIYGAATAPAFRGRGWMGHVLAFADSTAARKRGAQVSCLLPANASLYPFYAQYGYETVFYTRMVDKGRKELENLTNRKKRTPASISPTPLWDIREASMSKETGIQWEEKMVEYAININRLYGGRLVRTDSGYALYRQEKDLAEILEWRCFGCEEELLAALLKDTNAQTFCFRLSAEDTLFPGEGNLVPFGMSKTLYPGLSIGNPQGKKPYLGLTLD